MANDIEYLNENSTQQMTRLRSRSPAAMRKSSPFPNEMTNRRMQQYNSAQERLKNGEINREKLLKISIYYLFCEHTKKNSRPVISRRTYLFTQRKLSHSKEIRIRKAICHLFPWRSGVVNHGTFSISGLRPVASR